MEALTKGLIEYVQNYYLIAIALSASFRVLLTIAIFLDCKARNIGAKTAYTIATFFFPVITGIIYLVRRKSAQKAFKICNTCGRRVGAYTNICPGCGGLFLTEYKHPKEKQLKTASVILCVIAIVSYIVSNAVELPKNIDAIKENANNILNAQIDDEVENDYDYDDDFEIGSSELCYDRDGRAYSNESSVLYFSENGETYKHIYDESGEFFVNTESGNKIKPTDAYVDSNGNFLIIKEGLTHMENDPYEYTISASEDSEPVTVEVTFTDDEGNTYYRATEASWNYSGNTMICGNTLDKQ